MLSRPGGLSRNDQVTFERKTAHAGGMGATEASELPGDFGANGNKRICRFAVGLAMSEIAASRPAWVRSPRPGFIRRCDPQFVIIFPTLWISSQPPHPTSRSSGFFRSVDLTA